MATKSKPRALRPKRAGTRRVRSPRKWSAAVAKRSDALDLQRGVFKLRSARRIAHSAIAAKGNTGWSRHPLDQMLRDA